jgi:hypothetical protein
MFLLAVCSYAFVERPLRSAQWARSATGTLALGVACTVLASVAVRVSASAFGDALHLRDARRVAQLGGLASARPLSRGDGTRMWTYENCVLGSNNEVGKDISSAGCTFEPEGAWNGRRALVIGNSFAAAQTRMYDALVEHSFKVTLTAGWGCAAVPTLETQFHWKESCKDYWTRVVPQLFDELQQGDVVLMINDVSTYARSTPFGYESEKGRFDGRPDLVLIGGKPSGTTARLNEIRSYLLRLTSDFHRMGVSVVFQEMLPFTRGAGSPQRCLSLSDFVGKDPGECQYFTKDEHRRHTKEFGDLLRSVESERSNFAVLDIFDVACPERECRFEDSRGNVLYRDRVHLSDFASSKAGIRLLEAVNRVAN